MPRRDPPYPQVVFTCEHGGNLVPPAYRKLFAGHEDLLESHRGHDPGALKMATWLAKESLFDAPLISSKTSRLLVDLNRSMDNPSLFSEVTRGLSAEKKERILARYYYPYRQRVEQRIARTIERHGWACHISVHSFTPILHGKVRTADVGVLFDPKRAREKKLADEWVHMLLGDPTPIHVRVKRNYPYKGTSDGLTTYLRKKFSARKYVGIELEVNQEWFATGGKRWEHMEDLLSGMLFCALLRVEKSSYRPGSS